MDEQQFEQLLNRLDKQNRLLGEIAKALVDLTYMGEAAHSGTAASLSVKAIDRILE